MHPARVAAFCVIVVVVVVSAALMLMLRLFRPTVRTRAQYVRVVDRAELARASDAYFGAFTRLDAVARRCDSAADCRAAYLSHLLPADRVADPPRLAAAVDAADRALARVLPPEMADLHARVEWRVALLDDRAESGWPHTHGGVVCFPIGMAAGPKTTVDDLVRTLAHERVHVLQRARPDLLREALPIALPIASFPPDSDYARRRRSNPDLDGNVYVEPETGLAYAMLFPRTETGVVDDPMRAAYIAWIDPATGDEAAFDSPPPRYEHPWEAMAYRVAAEAVPES